MPAHQRVIYIGTMGWTYDDWLGSFYPHDADPKAYLGYYAQVFNSLEIDSTAYHIPRPEVVTAWHNKTPPDFRFTAKLPRVITHDRGLVDVEDILTPFLSSMGLLGTKIGCYLIQLSPGYRYNDTAFRRVHQFLDLLPVADFRFAIEFQHPSWIKSEVFDLLRKRNIAWSILDHPWQMPVVTETTADFAYIRWPGDHTDSRTLHVKESVIDRSQDMKRWTDILEKEIIPKVNTVFGFFHNHYSGHAPTSSNQMKQLLGLATATPDSGQQMSLF